MGSHTTILKHSDFHFLTPNQPSYTVQPLPVLCCLALAALGSAAGAAELLHSVQLDPDVIVHWTPENETNSITIRVEARTR